MSARRFLIAVGLSLFAAVCATGGGVQAGADPTGGEPPPTLSADEEPATTTLPPDPPPATDAPAPEPTLPEPTPPEPTLPEPPPTVPEDEGAWLLKSAFTLPEGVCEPTGDETVATDQDDYPPESTVEVTGDGYGASCDVVVQVTRPDGSVVIGDGTFQPGSDTVTTDGGGGLLYHYQLDGIEGTYQIAVLGRDGVALATTTFTDSVPKISASEHEGQQSNGTFTNGNVTQYAEGDSINFRFELEAEGGPASGDLEVHFTGDDGACLFFDGSFALGAIDDLGGPQPTVTVQSGPTAVDFGTSGGVWVVVLHVDYPTTFDGEANTARVNYTLTLSDEAGECNGSSQHTQLAPGAGFEQGGGKKIPVPANQIPDPNEATFTVHKDFSDDNPAAVSMSLVCDDGSVTTSPLDASDESVGGTPAVFDVTGFDTEAATTCTATEVAPGGYTPSGEPAGTCTATLAAGECTITNTLNTASFTVHKAFSDDNDAAVSMALVCDDGSVTTSPLNASDESVEGTPAAFEVTGFDSEAGTTCTATEVVPAGYTPSGEPAGTCSATLAVGECTITNTLNTASFTVHKAFSDDNDAAVSMALECDDGSVTDSPLDASDESVEGTPAAFEVTGFDSEAGTTCTATEVVPAGYTASGTPAGTCSATLAVGECTITNTLNTASFTVHKDFDDDNDAAVSMALECVGGSSVTNSPQNASDEDAGGTPAVFEVTGFDLPAEVSAFAVPAEITCTATEVVPAGYTPDGTPAGTCSATLETGECTITNVLNTASFTVHKDFDDDNDAAVSMALVCDDGSVTTSPQDATDEDVVEGTPATFTVTGFDDAAATTCTATEVVPAGYTASGTPAGTCSATLAAGECTITNTLNTASFTVHKDFDDDNPAAVSMSLSCDDGSVTTSPLDATDEDVVEGTPAAFAVTGFDDAAATTCTATEVVPAGYTASGEPAGTCSATLETGECTITNVLNTASFTVHKDFDDDNDAAVSMALECDGGSSVTNSPQNASDEAAGGAAAVFTVTGFDVPVEVSAFAVPAEITCTATEVVPAGYTSPGTCSATLEAGECTITNTLNTARVTVVKEVDGTPTDGWTFGAGTDLPAAVTPGEGATGVDGTVDFTVTRVAADGSPLTLTETLQGGFSFEGVECSRPDGEGGTTPVATDVTGTAATLTVTPDDTITCVFANSTNTATFTVHKDFGDDNPAAVSMSLVCDGGSSVTNSPQNASDEAVAGGAAAVFTVTGFDIPVEVSAFAVPAEITCTATEVVPPGYTSSGTCSATLEAGECTITNTLIPPPPPPPPPPEPPASPLPPIEPPPATPVVPPIVEPAVVAAPDVPEGLSLIRNQLRRAFVPGQPVRLEGAAPAGCDPMLQVDGEVVGPVDTDRVGRFTVDVDTSSLGSGEHLAEVVCTDGTILQTGFWVASPQTSSNTLSVVLVALLMLVALGWVSARGLLSTTSPER